MILHVRKQIISKPIMGVLAATAALLFATLGVIGLIQSAKAASSPVAYTTVPFTSAELANWTPDRSAPSGGANPVTFGGRDNVLQMGVVGANQSTLGSFYYTEGLQRQLTTDPDAVKADLWVDSSWLGTNVRAGLWGVGHDVDGAVSDYPIVEFTSGTSYTGWRVWKDTAWVNLPDVRYTVDGWNTLSVVLNDETGNFDIYINNVLVTTDASNDSVALGAVILNQYNDGVNNYSVRWSNFAYGDVVASPATKEACKGNGWTTFGFRNQGLCIQYVNTGKDSR